MYIFVIEDSSWTKATALFYYTHIISKSIYVFVAKFNKAMSTGYKIQDQETLYYVTFQIVEWVDVFSRKIYRDIVIDSLRYCQQHKGLEIYAFVIMSNHIHLLIRSSKGSMSDTIREFKSFTAKQTLQTITNESRKDWMLHVFEFFAKKHNRKEKHQFWTHENHAEEIYSNKFIFQKINLSTKIRFVQVL